MLDKILSKAVECNASDILIIAGLPISFKINGLICREESPLLLPNDTCELAESAYKKSYNRSMDHLLTTGDDDFSFSVSTLSRFRVNALRQRGSIALIIRIVSFNPPNKDMLRIPERVMNFAKYTSGLVLVTGAAGSGKSSTLACIVNEMNTTRNSHIITIEDPIEFIHSHKKSVVTQRELSIDTLTYNVAIRAALREAPDVILLGEMRDAEIIRAAVTAAETGHLILSTLHTIGVSNTVDRIIDTFPPEQQQQVRTQLALVLEGVISQKLIPSKDGTLIPAFEVMTVNNAIRTMIREAKSHQLDNELHSSGNDSMISIDKSLLELVQSDLVTIEVAMLHATNPAWLKKRLQL